MTFNYGTNNLRRLQPPTFGRWIWSSATGTTINWVEYDPSVNGKKKTVTHSSLTSDSSLVAYSQGFDCAISLSGSSFDTVKFDNTNAGSATKTSHWATVTTDQTSAQINTAASNGAIKAGNGCWAFRINGLVYVKPAATGAYVKSAVSASDFSTAIFDDSLKFAVIPASGKVYKYGTSDYVNIFNVTGLKSKIFFWSSPDLNRLVFYSYNNTQIGQSVPYDTVIKVFVSDGTNYNEITLPNNGQFITRISDGKIYFDVNFETIVYGFAAGTDANPKVSINMVKVDYSTKTVSAYEVPQVWYTWINPNFFIFGNYIYCMQPTAPGASDGTEFFFNIDKTNVKIVEIARRPVNSAEFATFRGGSLVEENGLVFILYDSEPVGAPAGTVRLIRRGVGSPGLQNKIRDIVPQDAGFVVENGQIRLCSPGCSYCVNPTICSTCSNGYVLNSVTSTCIRCGSLCATCTESDTVNCLTCVPGYYPVTSSGIVTCTRCHESCVTCTGSSASTCTSCKIGSYLDVSSNSCTECITNCISCTAGAANACDICKPGYVYN